MLKHLSSIFSQNKFDKNDKSKGYHYSKIPFSSKRGEHESFFDFFNLIKEWPKIVGPLLGPNTSPLKIKNENLVILTRHSTFTHELTFMAPFILEKIYVMFPAFKRDVKKIQFQTNPEFFRQKQLDDLKSSTSSHMTSKNETLFHPFSPLHKKLKREAENLFSEVSIEDEELKKILISLYIQSNSPKNY